MPNKAKCYLSAIIGSGGMLLLFSLPGLAPQSWTLFLISVALAGILSPLKLRLPGMSGTYAPGFIPILYGIAQLSLAETLVIGLVAAFSGSYINSKKRPTPVQSLFNAANLTVSIGICFLVAGILGDFSGLAASTPVIAVLLAGLYFALNTGLVSGVLSMLQGKALGQVAESWYVWSFPYYLAGAAAVTLTPSGPGRTQGEGFLVLVALLMLIHFYCGLADRPQSEVLYDGKESDLPTPAIFFLFAVLLAAGAACVLGLVWDRSADPGRLGAMLALVAILSTLKVRLPGMHGTMALSFVVLLAGVIELSLWEVCLLSATASLVQSLWFPVHRAKAVRVAFNVACTVLASATAFAVVHFLLAPQLGQWLSGQMIAAAVIFYGVNTLLLSTMLCLAENKLLIDIWKRTHFWIFSYYIVGAAAAAILVSTSRTHGWLISLLVLPTMMLVFVSYRIQVYQQVTKQG